MESEAYISQRVNAEDLDRFLSALNADPIRSIVSIVPASVKGESTLSQLVTRYLVVTKRRGSER